MSYVCDSCGKPFSTAASMRTHIYTIHEGHRDYKCDTCGKEFSQANSLRGHIRNVHEGAKITLVNFAVNQ